MGQHKRESHWFVAVWTILRSGAQARVLASRTGGAVAALATCAALIGGILAYTNLQRSPASGEPVSGVVQSSAPTSVSPTTLSAGATTQGAIYRAAPPSEGRRLAGHKQLMLGPTARAQLTNGQVDRRVTSVIEGLLAHHMVRVTTFGRPEPGVPLRAITIDCIDELPVKAGSPETVAVLSFFGRLPSPLAPESVQLASQSKTRVIVVTYP